MEIPNWREIQKNNFTNWEALCSFLELDSANQKKVEKRPRFPLNLPYRLARKIKKNQIDDPILRQFLPTYLEAEKRPGFVLDPVCDRSFQHTKKLMQKYKGRCLLLCSSACAMHCRFCFRQNYPYEQTKHHFDAEIEHIAKDNSLLEVILSGGDPLSVSDRSLATLICQLSAINHLQLLRIHTRFPIGIPERITKNFEAMLRSTRLQVFFVIHINHEKELDSDVLKALQKVRTSGATLLAQTVLLQGVNDSFASLKNLFFSLVRNGIIPYYLHHLDRVQGSLQFEVASKKGKKLIEQLRNELPGYAVPRYVVEIPFRKSKTLL